MDPSVPPSRHPMVSQLTAHSVGIVWTTITLLLLYAITRCIYNLYFHPLTRFPGPKLAAATTWWRAIGEVFVWENFTDKLVELHNTYGEIVRLGPNELHFSRPSVYHEVHNPRNKWDKDPALYNVFADTESTVSICEYEAARRRRDMTLPLFSRRAIVDTQAMIRSCLDKMCANIDSIASSGKPINFFRAFRCFALDAISLMCFGVSPEASLAPHFRSTLDGAMHVSLQDALLIKQFPLLKYALAYSPQWLVTYSRPALRSYFEMRKLLNGQVRAVVSKPDVVRDAPHRTIWHAFLFPEEGMPLSEPVLRDEAFVFVNAGADTVSSAITVGVLNVADNCDIYKKLKQELQYAWPDLNSPPRWEELERLPYLRAVVKESLRMVIGVVHPMARIVPTQGAVLCDTFIPGGTSVGISHHFLHYHEDIFPDPRTFKPERWMERDSDKDNMLVSFSRGPHSCPGVNMAHCELYLALAYFFRRYDVELKGVSAGDWKVRDRYLAHYEGPDLTAWVTPVSEALPSA